MAAFSLLAASSVRAALNLVQDPGFEGSESGLLIATSGPWYNPAYLPPFATTLSNVVINTSHPFAGNMNGVLTPIALEGAVLDQAIALPFVAQYNISFWIATPQASGGLLSVNLDGTSLTAGQAIAGGTLYTDYSFVLTTTQPTSGILQFVWSTTSAVPTALDIDNVSVTPVPEPTTMVCGALMLLPFAASTLRLRKKVSA
jgi:hypothetical protein